MGKYLCVATNGVNPSTSKMFDTKVQCKKFKKKVKMMYQKDKIVSTNCIVLNRNDMISYILVPPMFWIPSQLEGAYVGQDVTIECHSEAFPDSINYWIKKDGVMLLLSK